ncbi:DNA replication complex subunit Gins51 [Halalkalicoccus subterraneus]|uniref:DNA replication complex subunit Gins51 n=1 Tax=Halalkalicoccus subterraneus TaxID=2675002 RepID=UPI000EFC2DC4|nr:hypothetical protein [Halalkalicoccus subterraneus]
MDLDELQSVKDTERGKDSLQHLPDSFYADVADHLASLKDERSARASEADDPFDDPEIQRLTSEIDSTEQVVESIYERRVGKLVKLASFAAADMPADEEGLTSEERELFSDLVARIKDNRGHVLDVLAGESDAGAVNPDQTGSTGSAGSAESVDSTEPNEEPTRSPEPEDSPVTSDSTIDAADLMGDGSEDGIPSAAGAVTDGTGTTEGTTTESNRTTGSGGSASTPADDPSNADSDPESHPDAGMGESDDIARTTLRIIRDVGEIVGIDDREYELAADDIVTLPEANAGALVQREAAERLE